MKTWIVTALLLLVVCFTGNDVHQYNSTLKTMPVQDAGRIKPYDTFAREALELIYGKKKFEGKAAGEIVLTWMLNPTVWEEKQFIEIRHHMLKKALKLPDEQRYFTPVEIMKSERFTVVMQELRSKMETKEKLDPYFQSVQRLENQIVLFREIAGGNHLRIAPAKDSETWLSVRTLTPELQEPFMALTKAFIEGLSDGSKPNPALDTAVINFQNVAKAQNPALYGDLQNMKIETIYTESHPFRHAYVAYLIAALFLAMTWILKRDDLVRHAWIFAFVGLFLHTIGFFIRMYLTGRAPVSNMYETVVWVGWGSVVFSMIIEKVYRWKFILAAGSAVGAFCLIVADSAPAVLDPGLQPLEPVLRSNFWLTTHVLIITISYAAFFLAFALGDIGLFLFFKDEKKNQDKIKALVLAIYRAIQIGVATLAPGIILGGVWADYSWGRFWGWDPKETWALIALLGYLAVLHGRIIGWIQNFGMVASSIITFSLVIMAWYGVNFVLGAGLHTYGFGAGGVEYVAGFVVLHLLAVAYIGVLRMSRKT